MGAAGEGLVKVDVELRDAPFAAELALVRL
jgi:hypothetical protein